MYNFNTDIGILRTSASGSADIDTSKLTEMMSAMHGQAEMIRQERPVTAEDMANIVADYLAQTGLDEKSRELLKTLCLQLFTPAE